MERTSRRAIKRARSAPATAINQLMLRSDSRGPARAELREERDEREERGEWEERGERGERGERDERDEREEARNGGGQDGKQTRRARKNASSQYLAGPAAASTCCRPRARGLGDG